MRRRRRRAPNPRAVARDAVAEAAREYAPGLHRQMTQRSGGTRSGSRGAGARQAAQRPGHSGMRPRGRRGPGRGYGGFADFTSAEPAPTTGMATATARSAPMRPTAHGRWQAGGCAGPAIVLLGI